MTGQLSRFPKNPSIIPPGNTSAGALERVLRSGDFAVTAELSPPDSPDPEEVYVRARVLDGYVDAINVPDGPGANCHMSSVSVCALLARVGYATVMQIACRDRNRIAIQGDVLGAAAMGVTAVLCMTGDDVKVGDQPQARAVFDLDAISLIDTVCVMCKESRFLSGRKLTGAPQLFIGATANPFSPCDDVELSRLNKKIVAGAQFIQTQYCFDIERIRSFMAKVRDWGWHERCFILAGVGPLVSAEMAHRMRTQIPGLNIPDAVVERLARSRRQKLEGRKICLELIEQIREVEGIHGIHLMAYRQEETIAEIIDASGILQERVTRYTDRDETWNARPVKP